MDTKKFKSGDKVTVMGIGIGYVRGVNPFGYEIYFLNKGISGSGYCDYDLKPGFPNKAYRQAMSARV